MDAKFEKSLINLNYFSEPESGSKCGYCKKKDQNFQWGIVSDKMSVDDYENLMFKGWRRSGTYFYKPIGKMSCCQLYPIRLNVENFKINKNQKMVLKKFNKFLNGETKKDLELLKSNEIPIDRPLDFYVQEITKFVNLLLDHIFIHFACNKLETFEKNNKSSPIKNKNNNNGDYSSNIFLKLFYFLKKENILNIPVEFLEKIEIFVNYMSNIFEKFYSLSNLSQRWSVEIAKTGQINFFFKEREEIKKFKETLENYENTINNKKRPNNQKAEPYSQIQSYNRYFDEFVPSKIPLNELKKNYSISLEKAIFTQTKYEVYRKYQIAIHGDKPEKVTPDGFTRFLCDSPLFDIKIRSSTKEIHPKKFGSYHLVHKIDGKIFAVSVLDILPTSISAVYLFYDPEFKYINPGVFTAIKEIEYLKDIRKLDQNMIYYVMGFYIHSCPKMRYKGEYEPSEILCPVTLRFCDLKSSIDKLEKNVFIQLEEKESIIDDHNVKPEEFEEIFKLMKVDFRNKIMSIYDFLKIITKSYYEQYKSLFRNLIITFGKSTVKNLIFKY